MRMTDDVSVKVKVYSEKFGELKDFDGTPFIKQLPLMEVVDRHLAEKEEKAKTLLKEKEERLLTFVKTVFPTATQVVWKEKKKCTKTDIYFSLKIFVFVVEYEVCSLVWKYNFDLGDESSAAAPIQIPPMLKIFNSQKKFDSVKICDLFSKMVKMELEDGLDKIHILAELKLFNDK